MMAGLNIICSMCGHYGEDLDITLHQDMQSGLFRRISHLERLRLDAVEKREVSLKQDIRKLSKTFEERVAFLDQKISCLEQESSKIRNNEQVSQMKIAALLQKNEQLETSLRSSTQICQDALMLNEQLQCELERQRKDVDERDARMKQYEMVIDLLNQKLRSTEGQLNRLSKRFFTMIREE